MLRDVVLHGFEQDRLVDDHAPVLPVELLADDADRHARLGVEQRRRGRPLGERLDLLPLVHEPDDVALDLVGGDALGRGPNDDAVLRGLDSIEDAAQTLALVVVQALRDAVGARVRDEHHRTDRATTPLG